MLKKTHPDQRATTKSLSWPRIIFGTSALGNLYADIPFERKKAIVKACFTCSEDGIVMFDTAGKYGAGLALQVLSRCLEELEIPIDKVIISNKLGWYQTELTSSEPTFEKGVWVNLKNDAVQQINYRGILDCFQQGNQLLGAYPSQIASVHDPDEYLSNANTKAEEESLYADILDAYKALSELKLQEKIRSVGVGAKDWKVIQRIAGDTELDWVMIANSLTLHSHPKELIDFIQELNSRGIAVINSAVFNGGFLVGGDFYNYARVDSAAAKGKQLYEWREKFFAVCKSFRVSPAEACLHFGLRIPGISAVALSTMHPVKVKSNLDMVNKEIPSAFWQSMKEQGLLATYIDLGA